MPLWGGLVRILQQALQARNKRRALSPAKERGLALHLPFVEREGVRKEREYRRADCLQGSLVMWGEVKRNRSRGGKPSAVRAALLLIIIISTENL